MKIISIFGKSLFLSSGLNQESFAKTKFSDLLNGKNLQVTYDDGKISAEEYKFLGTKTGEDGITCFEGSAEKFSEGKLLSEILNISSNTQKLSDEDAFPLYAYSRAVDFISKNDFLNEFGWTGGGVIIDADSKNKKAEILFINPLLFETCAQNNKENYGEIQGKFIYKGLDSVSSLLFTRAVVAYKALTGHFSFNEKETSKRQEDIFDRNFTPIELCNAGIEKNLSDCINSALSLRITTKITAGMRNLSDKKQEAIQEKLLKKAMEFDSDSFSKELKKDSEQSPELLEKRTKYELKMKKRIAARRFLRRNKNRILAGITAIIVIGWFINGYIEQNGKLATTRGLNSSEATALLYTMIHKMDVPNVQEIVKGKETKDLIVQLSGYYVSSKQRLETNPKNGTVTPEKWFFYPKSSQNWMFGISNLMIDGEKTPFNFEYPVKKDKKPSIAEENGKKLEKGDEITHTAQYYFIRQAEAKVLIDNISDKITLRWNGKQWNVVKIEGKAKTSSVNSKDFKNEYHNLIGQNENETDDKNNGLFIPYIDKENVLKTLDFLRDKYEWLPDENTVKNENFSDNN